MKNKFKCSSCKKEFNLKDRGYFSYSCGNLCKKCWEELRKIRDKNSKIAEVEEEKDFEDKIRKIVNKVLDERNDKKRK